MNTQRGIWTCLADERGATAVEYGLVAALIVIALIAGLSNFAGTTIEMWNDVADSANASNQR